MTFSSKVSKGRKDIATKDLASPSLALASHLSLTCWLLEVLPSCHMGFRIWQSRYKSSCHVPWRPTLATPSCWNPFPGGFCGLSMPQNKPLCFVVKAVVFYYVISSHDTKWYPLYCMYLYVLYDVNVLTRSSNCDHSMSSNLDAIVIPTIWDLDFLPNIFCSLKFSF